MTVSADNPQGTGAELQLAGQVTDIAIYRPPEKVLEEARKAAVVLQDVISKKKDPVMMNGQQYLEYEDWQTVGRFYGITAKVEKVEYVQYGSVRGFSASAVALRADGAVVSQAVADCLSDEPKWSKKKKYEWRDKPDGKGREKVEVGEEDVPLFQLKSMAQTRACSKVLRNVLAWVVVLAGYRPTPAEELEREVESQSHGEPRSAGHGRTEAASGGGGQQGGGKPPAAAGAAPAGGGGLPEGATLVKSIQTKKGESDRGPWTRYFIRFEDGRNGVTFHDSIAKHAENAKAQGAHVIPKIVKTEKGFDLQGFEPWPKPAKQVKEDHPNPQHDEPINGPEKILTVREKNTDAGKRWAIQTDKRVVLTDNAKHATDAEAARRENMGLTPKVEIVEGKNRLLAWQEIEEAGGQPEGNAAPPAEEKQTRKRTRKAAEK